MKCLRDAFRETPRRDTEKKSRTVSSYKKGEAKATRSIVFFSLLIFVWWGFKEFGKFLTKWDTFKKPLVGDGTFTVPVYDVPFTLGLVVALVLTVLVGLWLNRILNGQRTATLLIDTETEVKKVSWPTRADALHSTWIVLGFVIFTAIFLTAVEMALRTVFTGILG